MKRIKSIMCFRFAAFMLSVLLFSLTSMNALGENFSDNADAIEAAADSVFMLEVYSSKNEKLAVGSGFIAFNSSLLVTNYHVIEGGSYIIAISDDKEQYLISEKCSVDPQKDIAILKFDKDTGLSPLPLDDQNDLKRAQKVVAIGSPAGLRNTVSIGNISAFYNRDGRDWIQFTAPISSGSSGGVLLNNEGKVIGVTTATYAATQNVNMAVRIHDVIRLYEQWDHKTTSRLNNARGYNNYPSMTSQIEDNTNVTVWVTAGGKKYHSNPNCSKMKSPLQMDLLDAIEKGYDACGKCFK